MIELVSEVIVAFPSTFDILPAECDWGFCNSEAVAWRRSAEHGWLLVCERHRAASPTTPPPAPGPHEGGGT